MCRDFEKSGSCRSCKSKSLGKQFKENLDPQETHSLDSSCPIFVGLSANGKFHQIEFCWVLRDSYFAIVMDTGLPLIHHCFNDHCSAIETPLIFCFSSWQMCHTVLPNFFCAAPPPPPPMWGPMWGEGHQSTPTLLPRPNCHSASQRAFIGPPVEVLRNMVAVFFSPRSLKKGRHWI